MYEIKYTTLQSLQYKAANRLKILNETNQSIFTSTSIATQCVDKDLLLSVTEEKEAFIDYYLNYVYNMPLVSNNHPVLRDLTDKLVIAELLEMFFPYVGIDNNLQQQNGLIRDAYHILRGLTYNINIHIPLGENLYAQSRENMRLIPIKLLGESFKTNHLTDTNIPEYAPAITDVKTNAIVNKTSNYFDIEPIYRKTNYFN